MLWNVYLDLDGDGDAETSILDYVEEVRTRQGRGSQFDFVAQSGQCDIRVNNADRRFNPTYEDGPYFGALRPLIRVVVYARPGAFDRVYFDGFVKGFQPESGTTGTRKSTISCIDTIGLLQLLKIDFPLVTNRRADYIIAGIINTALKASANEEIVQFAGALSGAETVAVTVNGVTTTYIYTNEYPADAPYYVSIGASALEAAANLVAAIQQTEGANTNYGAGSFPPEAISAQLAESYFIYGRDRIGADRLYRLGDTSGTSATDSSPAAKHGTYGGGYTLAQNGALTNDPDKCVLFNGSSGYVDLPTFDLANRSFSIEMWFYASSSPPSVQTLVCYDNGAVTGSRLSVFLWSDGHMTISYHLDDLNTAAGVVTFGAWHHFALTYNAVTDQTILYIDGSLTSFGSNGGILTNGGIWQLASANFQYYFKGYLDEAYFCLRALSSTEVSAHYLRRNTNIGVVLTNRIPGSTGAGFTVAKSGTNLSLANGGTATGGADAVSMGFMDTDGSIFERVGENWTREDTNAMAAIEEVVRSEYGYFFQNRDGGLVFRSRQGRQKKVAEGTAISVNGEPKVDAGESIEDVFNIASVQVRPRSSLTSGVIAKSDSPISIPGAGTSTGTPPDWANVPAGKGWTLFKLDFIDPATGEPCAATDVELPLLAATDWVANEKSDGTGTDYTTVVTGYVTFQYHVLTTGIEIVAINGATGVLYLTTMQVRGVAIVKYNPMIKTAKNQTSIDLYRLELPAKPIELPLSTDTLFAQSLAEYIVDKFNTATMRAQSVDFGAQARIGGINPFTLLIDSIIDLTEEQTGITGKHIVIGVQYRFGHKPKAETCSYIVEKLDDQTYWILENATYGVLGSTTRLGI